MAMKTRRPQLFSALLACAGLGAPFALARPAVTDPKSVVEQVADGLGGGIGQIATGFVFVSPTTVLAVKRGDGSVVRPGADAALSLIATVVPFSPADLNGDGVVNTLDLIAFISAFGEDCN